MADFKKKVPPWMQHGQGKPPYHGGKMPPFGAKGETPMHGKKPKKGKGKSKLQSWQK